MAERFDKNGIRILDPEHHNGIKKPVKCFPGEHKFKHVNRRMNDPASVVSRLECQKCDETIVRYEDELGVVEE